ncbi:MAG: aspartate ammonia-lyase [Phycisphaerae bacterium]|nr:aspartate ammonia-lyase [Phycisphaerae bacterium]
MSDDRTEHDLLGERPVPVDALYGIHTARAMENFPLSGRRTPPALWRAFGAVKLAAARTNHLLGRWDEQTFAAIGSACMDLYEGRLDEHNMVDALAGGAGTSVNMNANEVIANRALQLLGRPLGDYDTLSPTDDINLHQSTNDTYPTALRIAAISLLRELERNLVTLLEAFQAKEKQFAHIVKVGRTQYQDAVLVTLGREMAAYAEALGRDRWRVYKCEERLRTVNLGGTAVGTGLAAPRQYIFRVVGELRAITGMGLARAENLVEATQNTDVFVEVSGIAKACASNLVKVANDLRLLSSGPTAGLGEIRLPARQAGSSIMPGKINPVIPEAVVQAGLVAQAGDQVVTQACSAGSLELNAFLPVVADALLGGLQLLANAGDIVRRFCVEGMEADEAACRLHVDGGTAAATALLPAIGYERAVELARLAAKQGKPLREVAIERGGLTAEQFDALVTPEAVNRLGLPDTAPSGDAE